MPYCIILAKVGILDSVAMHAGEALTYLRVNKDLKISPFVGPLHDHIMLHFLYIYMYHKIASYVYKNCMLAY